jgi:hypothetical protein
MPSFFHSQDWSGAAILLISASQVARITGVSHGCLAYVFVLACQNFCLKIVVLSTLGLQHWKDLFALWNVIEGFYI